MNLTKMKNLLPLFICAMTIGGAMAQELSIPREEIRRPDFTISNSVAKASAAIAYNPNGMFLAVAGEDNSIRLYDVRPGDQSTAKPALTLTGHTSAILAMGFSGTNSLVSVSADKTAKIWEVASGELSRNVELNFGKQSMIAIAPDHQPLLAGGAQRHVSLWNYQTGKRLKTFEANDSEVAALGFTPDGKFLVIGTTKGVVRVMEVAARKITRTIDLDSPVYSLAASSNHIALGYGDGTVALLNLRREQDSVPVAQKQNGKINAVAFDADGGRFASASADGTIKIWNTETLNLLYSLEAQSNEVLSVVFSPDAQRVAAAGADGLIRCWTLP